MDGRKLRRIHNKFTKKLKKPMYIYIIRRSKKVSLRLFFLMRMFGKLKSGPYLHCYNRKNVYGDSGNFITRKDRYAVLSKESYIGVDVDFGFYSENI